MLGTEQCCQLCCLQVWEEGCETSFPAGTTCSGPSSVSPVLGILAWAVSNQSHQCTDRALPLRNKENIAAASPKKPQGGI